MQHRPAALIILDGWGLNSQAQDNAIKQANTPFLNQLWATAPHGSLLCSGEAVGLPHGQMGTSEVGHLNIGAGRVVYQSLVRISKALQDGSFKENQVFQDLMNYARREARPLHLMGLVSPGGVHSQSEHLYGILRLVKEFGLTEVFIHVFLDGRDTPPASGREYLAELEDQCRQIGLGRIATISGRYYAMDRDQRWDRVEKAYAAMVYGQGPTAGSSQAAIEASYAQAVTDEFVLPTVITEQEQPLALVRPGDPALFFNFRPDRARELARAFVDPEFKGFERRGGYLKPYFVCMTQYDETLTVPLIFPPEERLENILGQVLADHQLHQLRIAETEKYAHVTFFFNGGEEIPFPLEDRVLIPSPKVPTYDLKPEMSAYEVTAAVLAEIAKDKYDVIIMNYANCDMVGHTGILDAARQAVEAVDRCLAQVIPAILAKGGAVILTADHGNAELMTDPETHQPYTAHTTFPVPVVVAGLKEPRRVRDGILADLAPTLLELIGLAKPPQMTGDSLLTD